LQERCAFGRKANDEAIHVAPQAEEQALARNSIGASASRGAGGR
jgi:hypothetical protein